MGAHLENSWGGGSVSPERPCVQCWIGRIDGRGLLVTMVMAKNLIAGLFEWCWHAEVSNSIKTLYSKPLVWCNIWHQRKVHKKKNNFLKASLKSGLSTFGSSSLCYISCDWTSVQTRCSRYFFFLILFFWLSTPKTSFHLLKYYLYWFSNLMFSTHEV